LGLAKLFGSSGVRGIANVDLTPTLACKVSSAVATYLKAEKAIVAKDTRVSGSMLEDALVSGLLSCGVNVYLVGHVPTPVLAYVTKALKADVGFMLTASHNPPEYNGIKIFRKDSLSLTEQEQNAVEKITFDNSFKLTNWQNLGRTIVFDAEKIYFDMIRKTVSLKKSWKVVVDPGCGATFKVAPLLFKMLGCKVTALNAQPDGFFPARKSEPTVSSLDGLGQVVKALGADLGVAFDGDGDRVGFVDECGVFVDFDCALAAFAGYVLRRSGGVVVTNVEASMCFESMVLAQDGRVVRSRVGDVYMSEAVLRSGGVFGGEPCGAWVHPQVHFCPDGLLSACLFLVALEDLGVSVSEFVGLVPRFVTVRENLACSNDLKYVVVERLGFRLKEEFYDFTGFSVVDGVRLSLKDGWLLVRASGTEPLIRLTVEATSLGVAKDIACRVVGLINDVLLEASL
jgi:phosphoglucosamine mutase